jgi:hypothetical protein
MARDTMDRFRFRSMSYGGQIAASVIGRDSRATRWPAMANYRFRLRLIDLSGKSPKAVQPLCEKYSASLLTQITGSFHAIPSRKRGVSRSSRTWGGMRWTRMRY